MNRNETEENAENYDRGHWRWQAQRTKRNERFFDVCPDVVSLSEWQQPKTKKIKSKSQTICHKKKSQRKWHNVANTLRTHSAHTQKADKKHFVFLRFSTAMGALIISESRAHSFCLETEHRTGKQFFHLRFYWFFVRYVFFFFFFLYFCFCVIFSPCFFLFCLKWRLRPQEK